mmetsp:Transcript_13362/g.29025  ORF Transcript_13362/g.29025 Transcript_13362/m.29025 type:complete len:1129 (-) Transcript_13362:141-3527(-)|eukprot:CAMPEP_0172302544 /NCGR_PEP_ID=MMETSP1058-20130122/4231_1 /TAXON_ID=83371 /ORGANISM="Detonula confervacea, Strain CCMP 353" /LENGTH=1128 /DNA_ID=CAMNT_0013013059 /DNA_START=324 /DNA_END=3710 /DNA_ORIENTATION=+
MDDDDASLHSQSSYSSSSSDDDFLTSSGGGGGLHGGGGITTQQDREALVRKKLLESFYGASTPAVANNDGSDNATKDHEEGHVDDDVNALGNERKAGDEDGDNKLAPNNDHPDNDNSTSYSHSSHPQILTPSQIPLPFTATKSDLDSPNFHPRSHTLSHIAHSTAHTLLETNEHLALDIRTLDSTMQTLVYENYSKFIDATDAIKSIGTNVSSVTSDCSDGNKKNGTSSLDRLVCGMDRIQVASSRSESLLRDSREAVAEKLRIQRLLTRLDALLSLPQTLRTYISQGKYRMAVQSHLSATEILGRHSAGFESLRSIELECGEILKELVVRDLKDKLMEWSGGEGGGIIGSRRGSYSSALGVTVSSPKSIAEIFECAGTLLMLYPTSFSPGLDKGRCQSLALAACGQFLRERLVGHDTGTAAAAAGTSVDSPPISPGHKDASTDNVDGVVSELPISFLDGILESTTLYGVSFQVSSDLASSSQSSPADEVGQELLGKFVTTSFDKFISHVRMLLIQRSEPHLGTAKYDNVDDDNTAVRGEEEESKDDANFLQVSIALSHLLRSVRELASGLALPEVGLDFSLASTLFDQTVDLAEMLVRRRVAMKFNELRVVVVKECLAPLVKEVIQSENETKQDDSEDPNNNESHQSSSLLEIIQLASVALSDGLQMADDLIRATLQRSQLSDAAPGVLAPVDSAVVKLAVQKSAKSFGVWLASALEQLVGCEPSQYGTTLLEVGDEESEEENEGQQKRITIPQLETEEGNDARWVDSTSFSRTDSSVKSIKDETSNLLIDLLVQLDDGASERAYSNFLLSICEMCRLAERSMANTLNQSIQSAMEEDARVADSANTLFGDTINPHRKGKDGLDSEQVLSKRFQLAASRALAMYVMNHGAYAASELCTDMFHLSDARDPYAIPSRPREVCLKVFEIAKASCEDCISIVGGDLFVAPVAPFPHEVEYVDVFGDRLTGASGGGGVGGASSGLQLDVERMFIEKIQVYPHSLAQLEFTRNSVVSGILHVALSAFLECVRSSVFSSLGYRQMKVDAVFLRYIISHYVKDEFGTPEQNACSCLFNTIDDIMLKAGQRCFDHEVTNDDDYYDVEKDEIFTPYQLVQRFCEAEQDDVMKRVAFS